MSFNLAPSDSYFKRKIKNGILKFIFRDENGTRGAPAETTENRGPPMIKNNLYIMNVLGAPAEIEESAESSHACIFVEIAYVRNG